MKPTRCCQLLLCAFVLIPAYASGHAQDESRRYKTGQIKVGDRVLASAVSNQPGDTCFVTGIHDASGWRPGYDGDFQLRCDHSGITSVPATGDHVQPAPA